VLKNAASREEVWDDIGGAIAYGVDPVLKQYAAAVSNVIEEKEGPAQ
jgi:hypothetical protein